MEQKPHIITDADCARILDNPDELRLAIDNFQASYKEGIVLHGTSREMKPGDVIKPYISSRPAKAIEWSQHPPYIFAGPPSHPDIGVFHATVMPLAPLYAAGLRAEDEPKIVFMADPEVITVVQEANPVGTICILSDRTFGESPLRVWTERVSEKPVKVLAAFQVRHTALSFSLDTLSPSVVPGFTASELARMKRKHQAS